jgi:hypothetical protein
MPALDHDADDNIGTSILASLRVAKAAGIDAGIGTEEGSVRVDVDGYYRNFSEWPSAANHLAERVSEAVARWCGR